MKQLDQFRAMVADLRRQESSLKSQAREYEALQREISRLRERSATDPDARRRLKRLDDAMKSGGQQLQDQIAEKAVKLEAACNQLGERLNELSSSGDDRSVSGNTSPKACAGKRWTRAFV
jgi:septal ring factor EnvC (AmiA/AmiB activator)